MKGINIFEDTHSPQRKAVVTTTTVGKAGIVTGAENADARFGGKGADTTKAPRTFGPKVECFIGTNLNYKREKKNGVSLALIQKGGRKQGQGEGGVDCGGGDMPQSRHGMATAFLFFRCGFCNGNPVTTLPLRWGFPWNGLRQCIRTRR